MLHRIRAFLEESPGSKAKSIAAQLGLDRKEVNRVLHESTGDFEQNLNFDWFAVSRVCAIEFPEGAWLTAREFEQALIGISPLDSQHSKVVFILKDNCKPMLDFLARLLALCNQLVEAGKSVTLNFEGSKSTLTYLDRVGFFGLLARAIDVLPERPNGSLAKAYRGNNNGVIEFRTIDPDSPDTEIPRLLQTSFVACAGKSYSSAAHTLLSELFENVREHSAANSAGFACLQFYPNAKKIQAVISDNGLGIVGTLGPVMGQRYPMIAAKIAAAPHMGVALLREVFMRGELSQVADDGRGLGLKSSADSAGKFRAKISVRQSDFELRIHHGPTGVQFTQRIGLAKLNGTHICFEFKLDGTGTSP